MRLSFRVAARMEIIMSDYIAEKKREDAMRIFEALSHVDEELLARCEETVEGTSVRKRPIWYYGSAVAACLCMVICGAVLLNGRAFLSRNKTSGADCAVSMDSMKQEMAMDSGVAEPREEAAGSAAYSSETTGMQEEMPETATENGTIETKNGVTAVEGISEGMQEAQKENAIEEYTDAISGQQSGTAVTESCLSYNGEKITLQEARGVELLGEYIPDNLPAGYALESAYREKNSDTGQTESLSLCWSRGMDSIFWTISMADVAHITTVDSSKPETYDVHFYEIPYADTVPEEYRESFDNPLFREADFSLDMVKARMKVISDSGDTNTPRGDFSVLYDNGILVRFNGRGDAESIYNMFP